MTPTAAMETTKKIQKLFPNIGSPTLITNKTEDCGWCCVGGALVLYVEYLRFGWLRRKLFEYLGLMPPEGYGFPEFIDVQMALRRLNPDLNTHLAYDYAREIVDLNDVGKYAKAWDEVIAALSHPYTPPPPAEEKTANVYKPDPEPGPLVAAAPIPTPDCCREGTCVVS